MQCPVWEVVRGQGNHAKILDLASFYYLFLIDLFFTTLGSCNLLGDITHKYSKDTLGTDVLLYRSICEIQLARGSQIGEGSELAHTQNMPRTHLYYSSMCYEPVTQRP